MNMKEKEKSRVRLMINIRVTDKEWGVDRKGEPEEWRIRYIRLTVE